MTAKPRVIALAFAGLAAVAALSACGISPARPASAPSAKYTPRTHEVVYAADGEDTTEGSYTLRSSDGGTVQGDIDLPLKNKAGQLGLTFTDFSSGAFLYLSVQNSQGWGSVTCQIILDGIEISKNTSNGGYKIATCQGRIP